ncbi:MAG: PIG-L family deacetylase, partial [Deltaproteobacteria bacterium]|nr:PIG-L family deacetylase [Deltaproteobacteria bacterium]
MADILVISAHPDDETLFGGGTLARYARQGHAIYILETTRGEGGEVGEPPLTTRENLAA